MSYILAQQLLSKLAGPLFFFRGFLRRIRDQVPDAYAEAAKIITTAALKDMKAVTGQMSRPLMVVVVVVVVVGSQQIIPKSILNRYSYSSYGKQEGFSCFFWLEGTQKQLEDGIEAARQILMPLYTSTPRAGAKPCDKM